MTPAIYTVAFVFVFILVLVLVFVTIVTSVTTPPSLGHVLSRLPDDPPVPAA